MRRVVLALAAALVLCAPAAAQARMEVGFQDPSLNPKGLAVMRGASGPGTWVRMFVQEDQWPASAARYTGYACAAHAAGMHVFVSMFRWEGLWGGERPPMTPAQAGAFVGTVAARMGRCVDAYSPVNEPDFAAFWLTAAVTCRVVPGSATEVRIRGDRVRKVFYRRVKPGRGRFRKVVHTIRSKKRGTWLLVKYKRAHGRRARFVRRVRWAQRAGVVRVATERDRRLCEANDRLVSYRQAFDIAARRVRQLDPGALMVAGEYAWTQDAGVRAFYAAAPGEPDVDVIGAHTYHDPSANMQWLVNEVAIARRHGAAVWATEWGHHHDSPGQWWALTAARLQRLGAQRAFAYHVYAPCDPARWDTALFDCHERPRQAWLSLSAWIAGNR